MRVVLGLLLLACCGGLVSAVDILNADSTNTFRFATNTSVANGWTIGASTNPTLNMTVGTTYYISIPFDTTTANGGNHPFGLSLANAGVAVVELGLVNNGSCTAGASAGAYFSTGACVLAFTPNATTTLYYHCAVHGSMVGSIQVNAAPATAAPTTATPTTAAPTAAPANTISADATNTFHITGIFPTNAGYNFTYNGVQYTNPTLNLAYGKTYTISIEVPTPNHPFGLSTSGTGTAVADLGLVNAANGTTCGGSATGGFTATTTCTLTFTPPANTPQPLWYHCAFHQDMKGQIVVSGLPTSTPTPTAAPGNGTNAPTKAPGGSGFALVPGFAALFAVVAGLFAQ